MVNVFFIASMFLSKEFRREGVFFSPLLPDSLERYYLTILTVRPGMTRWVRCLYMNKQLLLHE